MRIRIVKIGNSRGIRIPKALIEQLDLKEEVELQVKDRSLVICPAVRPRAEWNAAFQAMATQGDDVLLDGDGAGLTAWDEEEWQW